MTEIPEVSAFMDVMYRMPGFTACFMAELRSTDEAVRELKRLSFVRDRSPQLPPGVKVMVQPLNNRHAMVLLGGALTADQRVETFRLLHAHDSHLHIILATGVTPPPGAPPTALTEGRTKK